MTYLGDDEPISGGQREWPARPEPAISSGSEVNLYFGRRRPFTDVSSVKIENHARLQESGRREPEHRIEGSAQMR